MLTITSPMRCDWGIHLLCKYIFFFRKRDMYRKKAAQLLREGNRAEARECLQRCIDISPEMALRLMEVINFWQPSKLLLLIYI